MDHKETALLQNLKDAGCEGTLVKRCAALSQENKKTELLRLLAAHRAELLDSVHDGQDKLDCLDYLIYQMKRNHKGENTNEICK